ncbi:hypothetical protein HDV63DRAFT_384881 [Trichoderma sp. SZMC 28014]
MVTSIAEKPSLKFIIRSTSKNAIETVTVLRHKWERRGWRNSNGKELADRDLVQEVSSLHKALEKWGEVSYIWITRAENVYAHSLCFEDVGRQLQAELSEPVQQQPENGVSEPVQQLSDSKVSEPVQQQPENGVSEPVHQLSDSKVSEPVHQQSESEISDTVQQLSKLAVSERVD